MRASHYMVVSKGGLMFDRIRWKGVHTGSKPVLACVLLRAVAACTCALLDRSSDSKAAVLHVDFRNRGAIIMIGRKVMDM